MVRVSMLASAHRLTGSLGATAFSSGDLDAARLAGLATGALSAGAAAGTAGKALAGAWGRCTAKDAGLCTLPPLPASSVGARGLAGEADPEGASVAADSVMRISSSAMDVAGIADEGTSGARMSQAPATTNKAAGNNHNHAEPVFLTALGLPVPRDDGFATDAVASSSVLD